MSLKNLLFAVCILLVPLKNAFAFGLNVNPGQFKLDNLKIGQSYDISKMARPFMISFMGGKDVDMVIDIYAPKNPIEGYEPIPDTSWIKLDKDVYTALAGEEVRVTAVLTIPNDEKYLGKKYDVRLRVGLKPKMDEGVMGVKPGIETRVIFSIFKERGTPEQQAAFEKEIEKSKNISFSPTELAIEGVAVGRKVDVKKEFNKSFKLTNLNDNTITLRIRSILPKDVGLKLGTYESLDNANEFKLSKDQVKISANQVEEVKIYIDFPDKPEYHNKSFLVICEAAIENSTLITQYRARVFITTK